MRKSATLDTLFPTIRGGILAAAMLQPEHWWFLSELANFLAVRPSSLQRELESLVASGLLLRRQDGRRAYFKANTDASLFPELKGLVEKTVGILPALKAALRRFGDAIEIAMLYGSLAKGQEHAGSDVDLLIVGTVKQIDLLPVLRDLESRFRREVNATLFLPEEFRRKRADKDHFIHSVLKGKVIVLKGALDELDKAAL